MADNNERAATLKTELDAGHPTTGAYNVDDTLALAECNAVNVVRDRSHLASALIFDEILKEKGEWDAIPTDNDRQWVRDILNVNQELGVPTAAGSPARTELIATLGAVTKAAIALIIPETVSQMDVIGLGTSIQLGELQNARALP